MLHKTKGIILRTIKFGETSLVVTCFTELFGLQSYIVNNVRLVPKKGTAKANYFQPASILDLIVYHNEHKNLQRIKEFKWTHLYQNIFSDIFKNAVSLFMVELLNKCVKEPEPNTELFYFMEDALLHLDKAGNTVTANFPIFFSVHLAVFFGFRISDTFSEKNHYLDLHEGVFIHQQPDHLYFLESKEAEAISHFLKILDPGDLTEVKLNADTRRRLLMAIENYYALHITDFGKMKTLPVLREVWN
ncbi:MAG: DNA repair protein RecO [Bacteroidota bacterium]|nr:DNA repair protein RecO [Bacteroidota bacterium]